MKKLCLIFLVFPLLCFGQTLTQGEFFVDNDPGYGNGYLMGFTPSESLTLVSELSLETVTPGFHTLYYRLKDDVNGWGQTFYQNVFVSVPSQSITRAEYFIDSDPGYGNGISLFNGSSDVADMHTVIPLSDINPGYHVLFYRSKDEGSWGETFRHPFYKTMTPKLNAILYSFDDQEVLFKIDLDQEIWELDKDFDIDVSSLSKGDHTLHVWVQNTDGILSEVWSDSFYAGANSINNPETAGVGLYPNPATDFVRFNTEDEIICVTLISLKGSVIKSYSSVDKEINVSEIPDGLYLVTIKSVRGISVHPLVINH
ncbi:T9SS type A sorting domain-containing protein [Saccharicrinis sp. FJH54]|uniref:T9SS type A sorting domain-containing protein n=1 Tax=Saccharicrinis sp. FJH54 TaxID=3344665 RepID=UPI0035D48072